MKEILASTTDEELETVDILTVLEAESPESKSPQT